MSVCKKKLFLALCCVGSVCSLFGMEQEIRLAPDQSLEQGVSYPPIVAEVTKESGSLSNELLRFLGAVQGYYPDEKLSVLSDYFALCSRLQEAQEREIAELMIQKVFKKSIRDIYYEEMASRHESLDEVKRNFPFPGDEPALHEEKLNPCVQEQLEVVPGVKVKNFNWQKAALVGGLVVGMALFFQYTSRAAMQREQKADLLSGLKHNMLPYTIRQHINVLRKTVAPAHQGKEFQEIVKLAKGMQQVDYRTALNCIDVLLKLDILGTTQGLLSSQYCRQIKDDMSSYKKVLESNQNVKRLKEQQRETVLTHDGLSLAVEKGAARQEDSSEDEVSL